MMAVAMDYQMLSFTVRKQKRWKKLQYAFKDMFPMA
jgi:hypothetical protein